MKLRIPEYCAFGDDSVYKDILVYAYAVFHRNHLERAERRLNQVKRFFKIPEDTDIHCRLFFNGIQREKLGLSHLKPGDVHQLVKRVIERMNSVPCCLMYGFCRLDEHISYDEMYPDEDELIFHDNHKSMLGLISQACFLPNKKAPWDLDIQNIEIFPSKDETKIRWMNNKKIRADRIGSVCDFHNGFKPSLKVLDHSLHQVADVFAYTCAHALSKNCDTQFFKAQLAKVKYWTNGELRNDYESIGISPENLSSKGKEKQVLSGKEMGKKIAEIK